MSCVWNYINSVCQSVICSEQNINIDNIVPNVNMFYMLIYHIEKNLVDLKEESEEIAWTLILFKRFSYFEININHVLNFSLLFLMKMAFS